MSINCNQLISLVNTLTTIKQKITKIQNNKNIILKIFDELI